MYKYTYIFLLLHRTSLPLLNHLGVHSAKSVSQCFVNVIGVPSDIVIPTIDIQHSIL